MSEPLCTCGHDRNRHTEFMPHNRCIGSPTTGVECGCQSFTPSPPPARSRDDAEKAIAAVLAGHESMHLQAAQGPNGLVWKCCNEIVCPYDLEDEELGTAHRAHVASVLADLMADGPTLADAWQEGHGTGFLDAARYAGAVESNTYPRPANTSNPYRVPADTPEGDR